MASGLVPALAAALVVALALTGCGKPASKPATAAPQAAKAQAKPKTGPAEAPAAVYAYSSEGKVDPFRPFGVGPVAKQAKPHEASLRQMDVGQFKLVGIAQNAGGGRVALVQDGTGRGYILTQGMTIGPSGGVVREISQDGVSVEERVRDYAGRLQTRKVVLKLVQAEEQ